MLKSAFARDPFQPRREEPEALLDPVRMATV
jgi:hypothetical protein